MLVAFLLKLQHNLKPCNQPCVRYEGGGWVYYGQVNSDNGKPLEGGFYIKQRSYGIYLYFMVDEKNQVEVEYDHYSNYIITEKIDGT